MLGRRKCLSSPRLRKKKRNFVVRRTVLAFLLVFSLLIGIRTIINLDYFSVKSVSVTGVNDNLAKEIKSSVNNFVESQNGWIVSNKSFVFLDKDELSAKILKFFPDIEKVNTVSAGLGNLVIAVQEKTPFAIWCNRNKPEDCFLIDSNGFAFNATSSDNYPNLLKVANENDSVVGANFASDYTFSIVKKIYNQLLIKKLKPISLSLTGQDLFVMLDDKTEVMFSLDSNIDETIADFVSVRQDLEKNGKWPAQYVDLRYGKKIFVKPLNK